MFKILLLQGANANYLGKREPAVYGSTTVDELSAMLHRHAEEKGYALDIFYTNVEGEAINCIYRAVDEGFDGRFRLRTHTSMPMRLMINAPIGPRLHTSWAIAARSRARATVRESYEHPSPEGARPPY